jgi:putative CocE/NonD family hydrolase
MIRAIARTCPLLCILLLASHASSAAQASTFGNYQPAALYSEHVSSTLYLPMRDGVRLALRIARPAKNGQAVDGRFPVIWQHTLAVNDNPEAWKGGQDAAVIQGVPSLTNFGYVVVQVARRGNGQSFGIRRGYNDVTETDDAYEVTEWLAAQPWSDGKVGIYGCSNTGDAAMHAITARAPHLKAAFAGCFSWSKYDAMRRGGIFAQWGTGPARTVEQDVALDPVDGDADKHLLREAAEEHQKSTNLLEMWQQLPYRDSWSPLVGSRFWSEGSVSSYFAQLRQAAVPLYIMGGWHDELRDQGIITLLNLPDSRIIIGPWKHCLNPQFALLGEIHRFFDTYLKGIDTGLKQEPRIHYYTMGASGEAWHSATTWPVAGMKLERLYLAAGNQLEAKLPTQPLSSAFKVTVSPDCPKGTGPYDGIGPYMQPCHNEGAGPSFAAPALATDLDITGNPVISLRIEADRSDANLFAYLEDRAPDGTITVITEGRLRAALRAEATPPFKVPGTPWHRSFEADAQPLTSGEIVTLHFELMPTSYRLPAGHQLQVSLTGTDFRERARSPASEGTTVTVHSDAAAPSWLEVPVIKEHGG